ncbi:TPA: phage tail protein [Vibrio parahaemolyticus]
MATNQSNLLFDIDLEELEAVQLMLGGTDKEFRQAYNRALSRTAVTLNMLSRRLLRDELQARSIKAIRNRLQKFRLKKSGKALDELKLWFGLNDMPVSKLKGRVRRVGTKKSPKGAVFTPASSALSHQTYSDSFVARIGKRKSIFTRKGQARYPVKEETVPINEAIHVKIEDEIFDQIPDIFLKHFITDLKGRVAQR